MKHIIYCKDTVLVDVLLQLHLYRNKNIKMCIAFMHVGLSK